ncbi:MAG TPA: hypothetical protein VF528_19505 [Pyrinomonadaceae bacterium]|jgi:hypothetical protein
MSENKATAKAMGKAEENDAEKSPTEKLEGETPTGSLIPGAQNPDSTEIKDEKSPNSE